MAEFIEEGVDSTDQPEQEEQQQEVQESQAVETNEEDNLPEKYKGKDYKEIVRMHQEAERLIGRQGSEVGELRRIVDDFIKAQASSKQQTQPEVDEEDFFADPKKAVERAIDSHPKIKQAEQMASDMAKTRALETLKEVDAIIAEDSRHSQRLLDHYDIDTPFTLSYYQGTGEKRRDQLIAKLKSGEDLALISDAGTPLISDPGFKLIRSAVNTGIRVIPIPGPTAAVTCLCVSGQPTDSFIFYGQMPKSSKKKRDLFEELKFEPKTSVFYDSPHRVIKTLEILQDVLPERSVTLCRELTKQHEETIKGEARSVYEKLSGGKVRGEFSLVISGGSDEEIEKHKYEKHREVPIAQQLEGLQKLRDIPRKQALRELAKIRGQSRRELYNKLNR